jgi:excisionase family DNA binding protein
MARILNVTEVAELLHVSPRTAYDYLRARKIPGRKVGKTWLVPEQQLLEFLATSPVEQPTGISGRVRPHRPAHP